MEWWGWLIVAIVVIALVVFLVGRSRRSSSAPAAPERAATEGSAIPDGPAPGTVIDAPDDGGTTVVPDEPEARRAVSEEARVSEGDAAPRRAREDVAAEDVAADAGASGAEDEEPRPEASGSFGAAAEEPAFEGEEEPLGAPVEQRDVDSAGAEHETAEASDGQAVAAEEPVQASPASIADELRRTVPSAPETEEYAVAEEEVAEPATQPEEESREPSAGLRDHAPVAPEVVAFQESEAAAEEAPEAPVAEGLHDEEPGIDEQAEADERDEAVIDGEAANLEVAPTAEYETAEEIAAGGAQPEDAGEPAPEESVEVPEAVEPASAEPEPAPAEPEPEPEPAPAEPEPEPEPTGPVATVWDGPFGPGSADANPDGSGPEGWTVKGAKQTKVYLTPDIPVFEQAHANVWFIDEERAQDAGFRRWDVPKK